MKARIVVTLKNGVLDPQGQAIQGSLKALGFGGVRGVRQGKVFDVELADGDAAAAEASLREMCQKLLANTVIENFAIEMVAGRPAAAPPEPAAPQAPEQPLPPAPPPLPDTPGADLPLDAPVRRNVAPPDGADMA